MAKVTNVVSSGGPESDHLFSNQDIPTNYYRSCLLSPRFFNVINRPITKIAYDSKYDLKLRLKVLTFLKHLIKTDHEFCPLILNELDLRAFLDSNILG